MENIGNRYIQRKSYRKKNVWFYPSGDGNQIGLKASLGILKYWKNFILLNRIRA